MIDTSVRAVYSRGLNVGDYVVVTAGVPFGRSGHTNLIQVHEVETDFSQEELSETSVTIDNERKPSGSRKLSKSKAQE
jgi:hypothetical protein